MREGPVPANPGQDESWPGWEPVITCRDPQTAEEREALLAFEGLDPERYQDEDEFLRPGEEDFTEAELAEIAEATAARSPVSSARLLAPACSGQYSGGRPGRRRREGRNSRTNCNGEREARHIGRCQRP